MLASFLGEMQMTEARETTGNDKENSPSSVSRRELLEKGLSVAGWGALFSLTGVGTIELVRFFAPSVVFHPPSTFEIGTVDDFSAAGGDPDAYGVIGVEAKWKKDHRFFVIREPKRIYALFARCTHLGCTINWFPGLGIFKCPCHGSQFHSDGVNFAGPAPRPLDRLKIYTNSRGNLVVDTSVVYDINEFEKQQVYIRLT
jgi:cytochrome b6-f complex iron-sulfur subunit